jgi:NADPH-dependent glutamate synthase beta subunit-like oxidoreductase
MDFLTGVKSGEIEEVSGGVAVIGGGSVALDVARTAVRLGADAVNVVCLERLEPGLKDSMLALTEEIEDSVAEGVVIHPSRGVDSFVVEDGQVRAVRCVECLSVRDEDGRLNPTYGDCVLPQEIEAGTVIVAIGQTADPGLVPSGFVVSEKGFIVANEATKQVAGSLFAAGDAVTGPATVVEALASGKRAALAVDRFLKGEDLHPGLDGPRDRSAPLPKDMIAPVDRLDRHTLPADERKTSFRESVLSFGWYEAKMEAERCLTCGSRSIITYLDDCQVCRLCQHYCPTEAIDVTEGVLLGSLHGWDVITLGR